MDEGRVKDMGIRGKPGPWDQLGVHCLGPIWVPFGAPVVWGPFGPVWGPFGPILGPFGPIWAHFCLGPILGPIGGAIVEQSPDTFLIHFEGCKVVLKMETML